MKQPLSLNAAIQRAASLIKDSSHIVAFTGAGISTDSGIPDLSGTDQILSQDDNFDGNVFTLLNSKFAVRNPKEFYRLYRKTFFQPSARPNIAHHFLKHLEEIGKLGGIATMNIDWLHQMSGSKTVYEYWGDMRMNHCIGCHHSYDWNVVRDQPVPYCPICGQLILPDFVLRGLGTYANEILGGRKLIDNADLLIIIGTKRQPDSFPERTPKIVVNAEASTGQEQNTLWLGGTAKNAFLKLAHVYASL